MLTLEAIERRRCELGVTAMLLETAAGLSHNHFNALKRGRFEPGRATLAALAVALQRLAKTPEIDTGEPARLTDGLLRALIALVCEVERAEQMRAALDQALGEAFGPQARALLAGIHDGLAAGVPDAAEIQLSMPQKRATADPQWRLAADMRRMAFGLANSGLGLSQAQIGRGAGVTRSAVHLALQQHEDARSAAAYDARFDRLENAIRGNW